MSQSEEDRGQHYIECASCTNYSKFYCNICHQRLCEQHSNSHLKEEESRKHDVVLYQERMQELPAEKCQVHPKKVLDLYCSHCQSPVCSKCFATDHKGHKVLDLEILYNESLKQCQRELTKILDTTLPQSVEKLASQRERTETVKKEIAGKRKAMKKSADQMKATVDTILAENNSNLDKMEKSTLDDMKNQEQETEEFISHLEGLIQIYNSGILSSKPTEVFKLNKEIGSIKIPDVSEPALPEFSQGTISKEELEKQFGKISQRNTKRGGHPIWPNMRSSFSIAKVKDTKMPYLKEVNHLSPLPHGGVWASDDRGNLIQSDRKGLLQKMITSTSKWCFHTVNREGELLYTDREKRVVYRITKNMTSTTLIRTGVWQPRAIYSSPINGDILVGMENLKIWKVTRYSKDGEKLKDIRGDNRGRYTYLGIHYITENINSDICTTCCLDNKVVVVTGSAQYRFSYSGHVSDRGFSPRGICTDILGNILVCNETIVLKLNCCSVHLLNQDGQFLTLLLTPDQCPPRPQALCVDDQHNLWIGCYNSSTVSVYKYLHNKDTNI